MSELNALLGISRHPLERCLGRAGAAGRERQSPRIQNVDGDTESAANRAEQMVSGNLETFVCELGLGRATNTKLVHGADDAKPGHIRPDDERSHARHIFSATPDSSLSESRDDAGAVSVADPDLSAIQPPVRA